MKVLIWCICFFVQAVITVKLENSGILLGAIPTVLLYLLTSAVATGLCGLYGRFKATEKNNNENSKQNYLKRLAKEYKNEKQTNSIASNYWTCEKCGSRNPKTSTSCRDCGSER